MNYSLESTGYSLKMTITSSVWVNPHTPPGTKEFEFVEHLSKEDAALLGAKLLNYAGSPS